MSGPMTVILRPPDDDRELLAVEPGGGTPPRMLSGHLCAHDSHRRWRVPGEHPNPSCYMCNGLDEALLLMLGGKIVAMGCDRAARVITARTVRRVRTAGTGVIRSFSPQSRYFAGRAAPGGPWGLLDLCDAWREEGGGVIFIDEDGNVVEGGA